MPRDKDCEPLNFGKHKGRTPISIADDDPRYILWLYDNVKPRVVSRGLRDVCEQDYADEVGFDERDVFDRY